MERDIVDRLRAMAGPIVPNVCTDAADEIERLRNDRTKAGERFIVAQLSLHNRLDAMQRERDAFKAQADNVVEVDCTDMEARIAASRADRRDSIRLSARDLWRMASDKRGREAEDEPWT